MSLVRYQPWSLFDQLHRDVNQLFDERAANFKDNGNTLISSQWQPHIDIKDEGNALLVMADLPGVAPDKMEVSAHNGVLTLKGEREFNREENEKSYYRIERSYGSFFRQFTLPDTVDTDKISARSHNGVLEIRIPKAAPVAARRIEIQR